jgi:hypothetical protein
MDNTGFSLVAMVLQNHWLIFNNGESVAQWTFFNEEQKYFGSKVD